MIYANNITELILTDNFRCNKLSNQQYLKTKKLKKM